MRRRSAGSVPALAVLALVAVPLGAEARGDMVSFTAFGDRLEWLPRVESRHGFRVTLSGGDVDISCSFQGGERPTLALFGGDGQPLADGTYVWEITLTGAARAAAGDRYNGRDAEPDKSIARRPVDRRRTQMGSFTVVDGRVVDATLIEPTAAEAGKDSGQR